MNYRESLAGQALRVGLEGLQAHPLRSMLTLLGIIFGVAAVIAMLSIGEGAKREALEQIALLGMNNILVSDKPAEKSPMAQEGGGRTGLSPGLTVADAEAMAQLRGLVEVVVPQRETTLKARYKSEEVEATVVGTTPEYEAVMNFSPQKGAFFNYADLLEVRRVCALGNGIKRALFYFKDPLGEQIKIGNQWFTVIGVMENKAVAGGKRESFKLRDLNQDIYIPIATATKRYGRDVLESEIDRIVVKVRDAGRIREVANIIKKLLDRRHNGVPDYQISIPEELLRQSQRTQRIFNIVMGAIAGISLLVGGIGIMNIMLATVLERTREIGVRRAVGARRRDILGQFLTEAVVLSFAGGLVGIALGWGMTKIVTAVAEWRTVVSLWAILLAFGVSAAVGILFGYYPARRAAYLDPIEALRYE